MDNNEKVNGIDNNELLKDTAVAKILDVKPSTLRNARYNRVGIPYIKINNGGIRYRRKDIEDYLEKRTVRPVVSGK